MMRLTSPSAGVIAKVMGRSFEASALASRVSISSDCMTNFLQFLSRLRGLGSRDPSERRADRHADAGGITLAQYVAGHHFACHVEIGARLAAEMHGRVLVHLQPEIGERDAGSKRERIKR